MNGDDELRREILALAAEDPLVRAELATDGSLFDGYHLLQFAQASPLERGLADRVLSNEPRRLRGFGADP